jgi:putative membrane protein
MEDETRRKPMNVRRRWPPMMWYSGGGMHWWGWMLGTVGMVAFWGLLIWAVWYFVTGGSRRPDQGQTPPTSARQILDERLARGEIDADQYRYLRELMTGDRTANGERQPPVATGPHS